MSWMAPVDLQNWWKCCKETCQREVNPVLNGDQCPDCGHTRCETCGSVTQPLTPVRDSFHLHNHHEWEGCLNEVGQYNKEAEYSEYVVHHVPCGNVPNGQQCTGPVSTAEFWRCCQCSEKINSQWAGNDCTSCSHTKCLYCTICKTT